jgi:NAD(P)-dependent dehydrogenase (short-subunit alcohol dehydrogenase family)
MTSSSSTQPDARTALITGGGTGIGRAAAVALASEGYEVTVAGRTAATLQETVKLVTETGGTARYVIADVHDEDAVRHAVEVAAGEPAQLTSRSTAPVSMAATIHTRSSATRCRPST